MTPSGPLRFKGLESVADNATDLITAHGPGPDYPFVFVNNTMMRATARRREDFIGHRLVDVGLPPRLTALWIAKMEEIARTRQPASVEFEARLADSTQVLQSRIHPLFA